MSFLSSRTRRRPRILCGRTGPETGAANSRSRASQKSPADARTAGRWQTPPGDPRTDPDTELKKKKCFIYGKLCDLTKITNLYRRGALCVADLLISFFQRFSLEALPRQRTAQEVHEHVTQRLEVVASGLLAAHVSIDGHVPSGTRQRFVFPIWYVLICI